MTSKVSTASFQQLYNAAKQSTEESIASSSIGNKASKRVQEALLETLGDAAKAAKVAAQKAKLNFKYFEKKQADNEGDLNIDNKTTVTTVVNWLLDMFKDVIDKINDQGELIGAIAKKLGDFKDSEASNENLRQEHDALVKKFDDLKKQLDERGEHGDNLNSNVELKQKQVDLEKKTSDMKEVFEQKYDDLDKKYDEVRQRGLKGNLIISSPTRTTNRGHNIPTLVQHRMFEDQYSAWRSETDMEMVQRLVELKTGIWIDEREITACHPLGRRERNTFIICIANRSPLSSWDMITRGMATADNNFSNDNIFINFQLTKRRGEICKEVRIAKKEEKVKNYEIDANGRIFVKYAGYDNKNYEIINIEDIEKYFPGVIIS